MPPIRVLIADDEPLLLQALGEVIGSSPALRDRRDRGERGGRHAPGRRPSPARRAARRADAGGRRDRGRRGDPDIVAGDPCRRPLGVRGRGADGGDARGGGRRVRGQGRPRKRHPGSASRRRRRMRSAPHAGGGLRRGYHPSDAGRQPGHPGGRCAGVGSGAACSGGEMTGRRFEPPDGLFAAALDATPSGIVLCDRDLRIVGANRAAERIPDDAARPGRRDAHRRSSGRPQERHRSHRAGVRDRARLQMISRSASARAAAD